MNKCQGEIVRVDIILSLLTIDRIASPQTVGKGYGQTLTICGDFTARVWHVPHLTGDWHPSVHHSCPLKIQAEAASHTSKRFPFPRFSVHCVEVRKRTNVWVWCGTTYLQTTSVKREALESFTYLSSAPKPRDLYFLCNSESVRKSTVLRHMHEGSA